MAALGSFEVDSMSLFSRFRKALTPSPTSSPPAAKSEPTPPIPSQPQPVTQTQAAKQRQSAAAAVEEQRLHAAREAKDTQVLATLVIEGSSTKIRQAAAEAIDDPEQIRRLIKLARGGNDKNVYKILARKRDAQLAREREAEQLQAEIASIAAAIEKHSHRPFDPLFTAHLQQLEERWSSVAAQAEPQIVERTQQAIDRAHEVIAQHLREVAAQAARELAAANEAALAQRRREEEEKAAMLAQAERAQTLERERELEREKREAEAQALQQIGGLIRKAHGALAAGSSKSAAGLRRAIEEKLSSAPALPPHLANQLKQLDTKLEELKDWKHFSVAPKRAELIERMEGLIGATLHPTAIAGHIKDLQEQWRTLSKGAAEDVESDWQRFHQAAQKAFEPCREYFEEQDRIKAQNLLEREKVFERLHAFEERQDWDAPDWRNVIAAVREAKQLWRQHSPVDPVASEALQKKFNELIQALQSKIDAEYASNLKLKRSLVDRASALLSASDSKAAIDEAKQLQERWKTIGPVPRREDQALWEEFRQHCDALFAKRQQEYASHSAHLDSNKAQAVRLCETLDHIATLSGPELIESAKQLPELRIAFDAIEELPRASARSLQDRFERAFERCRQVLDRQQAEAAERGWADLVEAADDVRAYQWSVIRDEDPTRLAALKQAAEDRLSQLTGSPKRGLEALRAAFAQAPSSDVAANERALRMLCVRAEILMGVDTPAEDQTLRREYQVKRLMQSMGEGLRQRDGELDGLLIEWLGIGPTDGATYASLAQRFMHCRQQQSQTARRSRS